MKKLSIFKLLRALIKAIYNAHKKLVKYNLSDDSELIQILGTKINYIKGDKETLKLLIQRIQFLKRLIKPIFRSGIGYDIHQINKIQKRSKTLGIKLPFSKLIGHSDADVGLHAICDSIFGIIYERYWILFS